MPRFLNFFGLVFLLPLVISACYLNSSEDKSNALPEYIDDGREAHASIKFVEDFIDFGTISNGEVVVFTYSFTNTGNVPLIINDVIASCGCTKTKLSKKVLRPNEKGILEVVFDSKGWYGTQYKSVTIVSNALTKKRSVTLKVNVIK
ncbi:MAG: DUF1573 domain-containing protein [Bacteroidales bacterium]|nr:DUF1573 domain-containing protein [Bacteroidales bacterium]